MQAAATSCSCGGKSILDRPDTSKDGVGSPWELRQSLITAVDSEMMLACSVTLADEDSLAGFLIDGHVR